MTLSLKSIENKLIAFKNSYLFPAMVDVCVERYSFIDFFTDIFAGIKIFSLLFPVLISVSIVCGVSALTGALSGTIAIVYTSLLGNVKYQISSISFPICVLTTEIITKYQYKGLFITSFLVCLILYTFGKLRIGEILKYTSDSFLSAIYVYVAIAILISQLQYILGIGTAPLFNDISASIITLINNINNVTVYNTYITLFFIGFLLLLKFIFNRYLSFFYYIILCMVITILLKLNIVPALGYINFKTIGRDTFNYLNSYDIFSLSYTLPSKLVLENIIIYAFAISLVIASQVSTCVNIGSSISNHNKVNTNADLISIGIANLLSVSFGGLFISHDAEMSIQNIQYKTKSVVSMLSTVSLLFCVWVIRDDIFANIPMHAISAILIVLSLSIIRQTYFKNYVSKNNEKYSFWTTLIIALYFGCVPAVFVGFVLSLFIFCHRMINIKAPSVYTTKNHDKSVQEFISNKYGYLHNKKVYKPIFDKVEVIRLDNVLSLNLLNKTKQLLLSCTKHAEFIIVYFQNIPFLDGEALRMLKTFVKTASKSGYKVILCGTNGLLFEILQKQAKESNVRNVFGYIIPNFQDAINKILQWSKK